MLPSTNAAAAVPTAMTSPIAEVCNARLGTTVRGKWRLDRIIGIGAMAAVYEATHKIGRKEALKILHPEIARSADLRARFEREARATNELQHPGAVEVRDIDVNEDGCPFLVMELLHGENLGDRAARLGGIEIDEMLRLVDELLDVLAAAHAASIVHRDIKLENLFVTHEGKLKVLDFGIARMTSGQALTRTGMRLGTTSYMSPEQVRGKDVDGRSDVFAVGATMFRLVARRRVHEAPTDAELVAKMASEPAPPIASVCSVSPDLALVIDRALAFDVEGRYPSAAAMQGDVRALRRGEPPAFVVARARDGSAAAQRTLVDAATLRARGANALASEPTGVPNPGSMPRSNAATTPPGPGYPSPPPPGYPVPPSSASHPGIAAASPHSAPTWTPVPTFAATAPPSFARSAQAAPVVAPPARPSRVGWIAALAVAGVCTVGGVGIAVVAFGARDRSAASHDEDDRPSERRKHVDEPATTTTDRPTATSGLAATPTTTTAATTSVAGRTPAPERPAGSTAPASTASPSLPGLGAAFTPPSASAKLPPGLGGLEWPTEKDVGKKDKKGKGR